MKRTSPRSGFSLIELLVVIGIIGVLSGASFGAFSSARRSARDNARIADLAQVGHALRLYYGTCGMFPGGYDAEIETCIGGESDDTPGVNPGTWEELEAALRSANVGVTGIPRDPVPGKSYAYTVQLRKAGETPRAQCYLLWAALETDHASLEGDLDDADIESDLLPQGGDVSAKQLYPTPIPDCDDGGSAFNYCVGNLECFHGF